MAFFLTNLNLLARTPIDWLDILVVAAMIYIVIRLLVEARSLSVALGIVGFGAVYWLAKIFALPLTSLILQSFFTVIIIVIVVLFQKEFRRLFSFVGFFTFRNSVAPGEATIAEITKAVVKLSAGKVGALIVFPARESVARFLEGGVPLRGDISEELMLSIFSEETPGHDGAVIVENNKLKRFGVHLPLAEHAESEGKFGGLRHRAALGLSERSDALIVVVSGETGSIDIARRGAWEHCADVKELHHRLMQFSHNISPSGDSRHMRQWLSRNLGLFAISFALAIALWVALAPQFFGR